MVNKVRIFIEVFQRVLESANNGRKYRFIVLDFQELLKLLKDIVN